MEWVSIVLFIAIVLVLMTGFPVAFALAGISLLFALIGGLVGAFDFAFLHAFPSRLYGIMTNETLIAVPLFVFMGVMLERSGIAESLLDALTRLFGAVRGGLGYSVVLVGTLMAASTGIVGATVVTMGLLSLPTMLNRNYPASLSCGVICAAGTLGQIIPPSIILVLLGDVLSSAYQQAQISQGVFSPDTISVSDLFIGALLPGLLLVMLYLIYLFVVSRHRRIPSASEQTECASAPSLAQTLHALLPPILLIVAVLGSIMAGIASPTEAASVGAVGATLLAILNQRFNLKTLHEVARSTLKVTCMVFMIFIGASLFSLVFRGYGGDDLIHEILTQLPGGKFGALLSVMIFMFLLGFVLDFIEITFVVVPIVGPILLIMGVDPVWLGIMIAVNLQTSFLTPPFGFALFYLRGVAPKQIATTDIYKGVAPFIAIQIIALALIALWPKLATWLPGIMNQA